MNIKYIIVPMLIAGCGKSAFLDKIPSSSLTVPSNLQDFQALLDNSSLMNVTPSFGALSSDNYYVSDAMWQASAAPEKGLYAWESDIYQGVTTTSDWNIPFQQIFIANQVLEGINNLPVSAAKNTVEGSAFFFRAHAYYQLAQVFAPPYQSMTADNELGLPIRLSTDIDQLQQRSTLKDMYIQILADVHAAIPLLTDDVPLLRNRPSRPAAHGLAARIYLSMGLYEQAKLQADSCLALSNSLIDFNTIPLSVERYLPFSAQNEEVLFQSSMTFSLPWYYLSTMIEDISIDSNLINAYSEHDLRRPIYFFKRLNGSAGLNGNYGGAISDYLPFTGLAVDEVYLIRAESAVRNGDVTGALQDLNTLLEKRTMMGEFVPYENLDAETTLHLIIAERRKELVFRQRWDDLLRLNVQGAGIVLTRFINGETISLPPNSALYTLPIPADEISRSGIIQNER